MYDFNLSSAPAKRARVEIIPLIDVVFFLLATFVLFILSLEKIAGLSLDLPQGGQPKPEDTTVFVRASDFDTYYWKQGASGIEESLSSRELKVRLDQYSHEVPVPRVLVSGDERAKFGSTVKALDAAHLAGIHQVSLETSANPARR